MSILIKETDEYLELKDWVHRNTDSYSDWELDEDHKPKYSEKIQDAENNACYEIEVIYRIYKDTGIVGYIQFKP